MAEGRRLGRAGYPIYSLGQHPDVGGDPVSVVRRPRLDTRRGQTNRHSFAQQQGIKRPDRQRRLLSASIGW